MVNGTQMTFASFMPEMFQRQTSGVSEAHANHSQWRETEKGLTESVDSLVRYLDFSAKQGKKIDPDTLSVKMLRECSLRQKDLIFLGYSWKWIGGGYDVEWQLLNSKWFVPQNRERVFTIGHLRGCSSPKIFPIEGADRKDSLEVNQIGQMNRPGRDNLNQYRVYDTDGIAPTLTDMQGGGREPHTIYKFEGGYRDRPRLLKVREDRENLRKDRPDTEVKRLQRTPFGCFFIDKNEHGQPRRIANTITAREDRGVSVQNQTGTAIGVRIDDLCIGNIRPQAT